MSARPAGLGSWLVTDLVLPIAAFYVLKACGMSGAIALTVGGGLSGVRVLLVALRNRRFDALAVVVMGFFALGLITLAITGSARVVMAADSLPTAVAGLVLLASLGFYDSLMFRLLLPVLSGGQKDNEPLWHAAWTDGSTFRHSVHVITVAWSLLLIGESAGRLILIATLPVDVMVGLSKVLQVMLVLSLVGFAGWYAKRTGLGMRAYVDSIAVPEYGWSDGGRGSSGRALAACDRPQDYVAPVHAYAASRQVDRNGEAT
jgi:hypothetical protein